MELLRYRGPEGPRVGVSANGRVAEVAGVGSFGELLALPLSEIRALIEEAALSCGTGQALEELRLLAPVDGLTEVWACGVTYEISRDARVEESRHAATVYERVYDAERPELFFKATAWRVAGDGDAIAIRDDSTLDVPEPEVALVLNRSGEVVGYTACNDVSSRSIEGENPLYLPQAKIYLGSCAVGPVVRPAWEVPDPYDLRIGLVIERDAKTAWEGETSTAKLHRRFEELAEYLFRADRFPEGAVLSTGTCLVPEAPFGLAAGDVVSVSVAGVGTLRNRVVRGVAAVEAAAPPELRATLGLKGRPEP
jgi:2-dehydro-3-deoxy-D-arabinonate dehydratase